MIDKTKPTDGPLMVMRVDSEYWIIGPDVNDDGSYNYSKSTLIAKVMQKEETAVFVCDAINKHLGF